MSKTTKHPPVSFVRSGPAQYVQRAGILRKAGDCIAPWGNRALISGGKNALAAAEEPLIKSLEKKGLAWRKHVFTGECSLANIARIKGKAQAFKANIIIGVGGGKSLDAAKQAASDLGLPMVCIPTIAATCAATSAVSVIYYDRGEFQKNLSNTRNPSVVLVDPEIIARSPVIYLRSGILDSLAKWYEGRAVVPRVQNPDVQALAAFQLARGLYEGHRKDAAEAVRLNVEHRVEGPLIRTIDRAIFLTGLIQTLARGSLFFGIAHSLHHAMTIMKESHGVLHGLKVGYGIIVQIRVEKCPQNEFDDVLAFFRELGLEPTFKGLNLPFDRKVVLSIADKTATRLADESLYPPVSKVAIASVMEDLEEKLAVPS
jgi:glycerol dehydrogenase